MTNSTKILIVICLLCLVIVSGGLAAQDPRYIVKFESGTASSAFLNTTQLSDSDTSNMSGVASIQAISAVMNNSSPSMRTARVT